MGGKGSKQAAPPPPVESGDGGFDSEMMMGLLKMMMSSSQAPQAPVPVIPDAPEVTADPVIDFSSKQKELANKVRADYTEEQSRKRGRLDTILTSPLLDDELTNTDSLLG